jgi:hypothetical protein
MDIFSRIQPMEFSRFIASLDNTKSDRLSHRYRLEVAALAGPPTTIHHISPRNRYGSIVARLMVG